MVQTTAMSTYFYLKKKERLSHSYSLWHRFPIIAFSSNPYWILCCVHWVVEKSCNTGLLFPDWGELSPQSPQSPVITQRLNYSPQKHSSIIPSLFPHLQIKRPHASFLVPQRKWTNHRDAFVPKRKSKSSVVAYSSWSLFVFNMAMIIHWPIMLCDDGMPSS